LLSGSGGLLSIGRSNMVVSHLMSGSEKKLVAGIAGAILVASPLILLTFVGRMKESKRELEKVMSHHSRNRVQAILLRLELLESEASPGDLPMIKEAERSCYALIDSIEEISKR
jgi:hypothetical protein